MRQTKAEKLIKRIDRMAQRLDVVNASVSVWLAPDGWRAVLHERDPDEPGPVGCPTEQVASSYASPTLVAALESLIERLTDEWSWLTEVA